MDITQKKNSTQADRQAGAHSAVYKYLVGTNGVIFFPSMFFIPLYRLYIFHFLHMFQFQLLNIFTFTIKECHGIRMYIVECARALYNYMVC